MDMVWQGVLFRYLLLSCTCAQPSFPMPLHPEGPSRGSHVCPPPPPPTLTIAFAPATCYTLTHFSGPSHFSLVLRNLPRNGLDLLTHRSPWSNRLWVNVSVQIERIFHCTSCSVYSRGGKDWRNLFFPQGPFLFLASDRTPRPEIRFRSATVSPYSIGASCGRLTESIKPKMMKG